MKDAIKKTSDGQNELGPLILYCEGQVRLPNGATKLMIRCQTAVDYADLPNTLEFGKRKFLKIGWNSSHGIAIYLQPHDSDRQLSAILSN